MTETAADVQEEDSEGGMMARLSERQREIVQLLASGLTQQEIAQRLGLSYRTIRGHLQDARERTGLRTSLDLAVCATKEAKAVHL